jgi:TPR repeat protein
VTADDAQAMHYLKLAADQGYSRAAQALGTMYANGRGAPQDYSEAFVWFQIAAARGQGIEREQSIKMLDAAAARLSSEQRADAERKAQSWKPPAL